MAVTDDQELGFRTIGGAAPPPPAPAPRVVDTVTYWTQQRQIEQQRDAVRRQQESELAQRQQIAYQYGSPENEQFAQRLKQNIAAGAPEISQFAMQQAEARRRQTTGGYSPNNEYANPATETYARTLGEAQAGSGGLQAALREFPDLMAQYNRIPDRYQNLIPGPIGLIEQANEDVPGFKQLQQGAVRTAGAIGAGTLAGRALNPVLPGAAGVGKRISEEVATAIFPVKAWEVAATLAPAAKATNLGELALAVTLGDVDAVSAIRTGAKRAGLSEEAIQRGLQTLQGEEGVLKLPFGKAPEVAETVPAIAFPDEVKGVLKTRGVNVAKAEQSWALLPEVNRDLITNMAKTSVTDFDRRKLLAEGRKRQADAINAAYSRFDLPFAERQRLASEGMKGAILPEFTPFGKNYTPEQLTLLTDQIDEARSAGRISGYQWKTAGKVFENLMTGGKQLEPAEKTLMGRIFGPEFEAAIPEGKNWETWRELTGALGVPQALVSTLDASAILRQMAPVGWAHPNEYFDAIGTIRRAIKNDASAAEVMHELLSEPWVTQAPYPGAEGLSFLDQSGRLADIGGHLAESEGQFSALNQSMATRAVEKLPWVKPSERAFNVPINVLRGKVYARYAENMWQAGERDPAMYKAVADVIDHGTGWGSFKVGEIAKGLNAFFSPRNFVARFQVLMDPFVQPGSLFRPSARQLAARNLAGFTASNVALLGAIAASGRLWAETTGNPNPVHIELDPRSSDWGKGKIGNMRVDFTGGFGSILRLGARLSPLAHGQLPQTKTASGKIKTVSGADLVDDFIRGKMGVVPGAVWDAFGYPGGEQYKQDLTKPSGWRTLAYNSLTPFFVQDVVEAWRQEGPYAAAIAAPASFFGAGVNTYASPTADLDAAVKKDYPGQYKYYSDLPNYLQGEFDKAHPDLVDAAKKARADSGFDTFDKLNEASAKGLADLGTQLAAGTIGPKEYRQAAGDLVHDQATRFDQALTDAGLGKQDLTGDRKLLSDFFDAVNPAVNAQTGQVDFETQDRLEDDYRSTLTPDQEQHLDRMLTYSTDSTYQQLKLDRKTLEDGGYFDRQDNSFADFQKRVARVDTIDPQTKAAVAGMQNTDDLRRYAEQQAQQLGYAPELYDRTAIWNQWQGVYESQNTPWLGAHPEFEVLGLHWGYQSRVHSRAAADLYEQQTGLKAPLPAP